MKKLGYWIIGIFCIFCMFNCTKTDSSVLPPKIDFAQYIIKDIQIDYPDIPSWGTKSDVRIWGWSKTGKLAFSEEYIRPETEEDIFELSKEDNDFSVDIYVPSGKTKIVPAHIKRIEYYIIDVINDEIVFECSWDPYEDGGYENPSKIFFDMSEKGIEKMFNIQSQSISDANDKHGIIYNKIELLAFPLNNNNFIYNCRAKINFTMEDMDLSGFNPYIVERIDTYDIIVSRNDGKSKKITSSSLGSGDHNYFPNVHICGYLKSPYENRIVVVYAEELAGLGEGLFWGFSGCHLDVGFN